MSPEVLLPEDLIGKSLEGTIQIEAIIGSGATSTVYKAWHHALQKSVAIKVLHQEVNDELQKTRFRQEIQHAQLISHKGIVKMHDFGLEPSPFIVMEYVKGETLAEIIARDGAQNPDSALPQFLQICDALIAAHENKIIHRDLKPSNVMIETDTNAARLLDFGISRNLEGINVTRTGDIIGSPAYMSPEQYKGLVLSARTDIYAMGCLMHEVLTGKKLFEVENSIEYMYKHLQAKPPGIRDVRKDIRFPSGLQSTILKCLSKEPDNRFPTMAALKSALETIAEGRGKDQRLTIETKTLPKQKKRGHHKHIILASVAGLVLVGSWFIWAALNHQKHFLEDPRTGDTIPADLESGLWNHFPIYMAQCEEGYRIHEKDPKKAKELMTSALAQAKMLNADWWQQLEIHYRMAQMFYARQQDDDALKWLKESLSDLGLDYAPQRRMLLRCGNIHLMMSEIYYRSKDYTNCLENAQEALSIFQSCARSYDIKYDGNLYPCYLLIGRSTIALGQEEEAIAPLSKAREIVVPEGSKPSEDNVILVNKLLAQCYLKTGDAEKVYPLVNEMFRIAKSVDVAEAAADLCAQALRKPGSLQASRKKLKDLSIFKWDDADIERILNCYPELKETTRSK